MACLTVLNGPKQGKSIDLLRNKTRIIGRDHTCGVVVGGRKVSRWHCEVFFNGHLDGTPGGRREWLAHRVPPVSSGRNRPGRSP